MALHDLPVVAAIVRKSAALGAQPLIEPPEFGTADGRHSPPRSTQPAEDRPWRSAS